MDISFTEAVYAVVKKIPLGSVMTYAEVAKAAGRPRAYRAVGNILTKNRSKDIPCHRVIRSDGELGGYAWGADKKRAILKKEGYPGAM
jgi:O-6-methylguanine DNA methyltransferase